MRAVAESVRAFLPDGRRYLTLGTDGFGRSDTRAALRDFFGVDAAHIVKAVRHALSYQATSEQEVSAHSSGQRAVTIDAISAVTLATHDMARALRFYLALGFPLRYGGDAAEFSSLSAGNACLNLTTEGSEREWSWWGRTIFYVSDVDALYQEAIAKGLAPGYRPARRQLGRAIFPHHRPRWP